MIRGSRLVATRPRLAKFGDAPDISCQFGTFTAPILERSRLAFLHSAPRDPHDQQPNMQS